MKKLIDKHESRIQRALEIFPGFVSWNLILFPVWGSFLIPEIVAYFIIAFDVYWFYRSFSTALLAIVGHIRIQAATKYNWMTDVKQFPDWKKIHHVVIIPNYKEPLKILRRSLTALVNQTFPTKNISIVLAFEKREGKDIYRKSKILTQEFSKNFANFISTYHPDLPKEVKGKSSNQAWAAKIAYQKIIQQKKININYVTISSQDVDSCHHPQYFACLAYKFLDNPKRFNLFWQPAILFYNNIWRLPSISRVFNSISSIVHIGHLVRRDRLINFSTYSTSFKLIKQIGFWDTDVIPEDYRIFFKSFFYLKGKLEVEAIYLPVYADAAESTSFIKTIKNQYEQVKRWAWGVSDDPYIIKKYLTTPQIPFWEKTIRVLKVLEDHLLWPVYWFILTLGAALPPLINKKFSRTILGKRLPQTSSAILTLCTLALIILIIIHLKQPVPHGIHVSKKQKLLAPFEFILLPIAGFIFSALPGLDAHTRLMLGKYLEYRVTEKVA